MAFIFSIVIGPRGKKLDNGLFIHSSVLLKTGIWILFDFRLNLIRKLTEKLLNIKVKLTNISVM